MQIIVNGEATELAQGCSVEQLLNQLGLGQERLAVEVNLEIVPRGSWSEHRLQDGDRVEVVRAIGGGAV